MELNTNYAIDTSADCFDENTQPNKHHPKNSSLANGISSHSYDADADRVVVTVPAWLFGISQQRLMRKAEVCEYLNVTAATLVRYVNEGIIPPSLPNTNRWDRKAIDAWLDQASGVNTHDPPLDDAETAYAAWNSSRN